MRRPAPIVTVVMTTWSPTDRRFEVMKQSLGSLQACTHCPHVLVVFDNGPTVQTEWLVTQTGIRRIGFGMNLGIGAARNLGASLTQTKYIAFVDNDIEYFDNWLKICINVLDRHPYLPAIVTPLRTAPMKKPKHHIGNLGPYQMYNRCGGGCVVMRRSDFVNIGSWALHSQPGGDYCDRARAKGYFYLWHPEWNAKHLCSKSSYNHRKVLIDGKWTDSKTK